jgi:type VI secretion system protein ImpC
MGVVLISDLGLLPQPITSARALLEEWQSFFRKELRASGSVTVIVPRDSASLPVALRRYARLIPWDTRSSFSRLADFQHVTVAAKFVSTELPATDEKNVGALNPLAELDAQTLKLASACALAVRIEPPLLRAMRIQLLPECGAEVEARLWFSQLVSDRASTGLVFDAGLRELLLRRLRGDENLLSQSWHLVSEAHTGSAPALRAEEQACYHWLRGDEEAARTVLRSMVATVVDPSRTGAWRWASQAVTRLPRALLRVEEAQMLAMGAALRSGQDQLLQDVPSRGGAEWHWLRPSTREVEVAVILREGMIEFSPATAHSALRMGVPDGPTVLIEIAPSHVHGITQPVKINPRQRTLVPVEGDSFELQVIGGQRCRLRARQAEHASPQKIIARNSPPRVQITYDVEIFAENKPMQLPFVMVVLSDLSGHPAEPLPPVAFRKFFNVNIDNFDDCMKAIRPRVAFQVEDVVTGQGRFLIDLTFENMSGFSPAAVAQTVEPLKQLLDARQQLAMLVTYMDGKVGAEELIFEVLGDADLLSRLAVAPKSHQIESNYPSNPEGTAMPASHRAPSPLAGLTLGNHDLDSLLQKEFKPRTDADQIAVENAVSTLAQQAVTSAYMTSEHATSSIAVMIAEIDKKLSAQVNTIIHHAEFQKLEGAWRGLHYLVVHTETHDQLQIRVLDIAKNDLGKSLRRFKGDAWDQSPLFNKIYVEEFGQFGGTPIGCLVGDYHFDQSPADVDFLGEMAKIAAAALAPFIAGAAPALLQMDSWRELSNIRDLSKVLSTPEYAAWRALRASDDARYIALAMPRFLARLPYGARTNPIEEFNFEEDVGSKGQNNFAWINSAYAMAANITRAFNLYGWCAMIRGVESGGSVVNLPRHVFSTDDGNVDSEISTEIQITDRNEAELASAGFMPLMHRRNTDTMAFIGAQSLYRAPEYSNLDATTNANLSARLPYVFACARFAHYLKCIARDKIGSFADPQGLENFLNRWLTQYIDANPSTSSTAFKAMRPLAAAHVEVDNSPDPIGGYRAKIYLQPHFQLEGLTTSLRLVTRLP